MVRYDSMNVEDQREAVRRLHLPSVDSEQQQFAAGKQQREDFEEQTESRHIHV